MFVFEWEDEVCGCVCVCMCAIKSLTVFLLHLYRLGIVASSGSQLSRTPLRAFIHRGQHRKKSGKCPYECPDNDYIALLPRC